MTYERNNARAIRKQSRKLEIAMQLSIALVFIFGLAFAAAIQSFWI